MMFWHDYDSISGYWAFSFASGVQEFTVQENPPSFVPAMMSTMSDRMSFIERVWNMVTKLVSKAFMLYHASIVGELGMRMRIISENDDQKSLFVLTY